MYSTRSGLILGFHGCELTVADQIITSGQSLRPSENVYDWLGTGIYFWEQSHDRALDYVKELQAHPERTTNPIITPGVIGAVLDLGFCLDLVNLDNLKLLQDAYKGLKARLAGTGKLPRNLPGRDSRGADYLRRKLDCMVINSIHLSRKKEGLPPFDSVRGVFWEGSRIYPTAGFRQKNHIQIAILNPNCVKGYFRPRTLDPTHNRV
jgi:hypothetical protein